MERWDHRAVFDRDPKAQGKTYGEVGGFLEDAARFDAAFFDLGPEEARQMDPQQRMLLEEAWRALEDAGVPPHTLVGRRVGIFVGARGGDYHQHELQNPTSARPITLTGQDPSILAARIAYALDLKGPNLSVNTACTSIGTAIQLAARDLLAGGCEMALAGGAFVMCTPQRFLMHSRSGLLSPSGMGRSFDAAADGFVLGEAAGFLVLKPLAAALRDGDPIRGVITALRVGQKGHDRRLLSPSAQAQTELLVDLFEESGVDPRSVGLLEAHATGTLKGDAAEVTAMAQAFARFTKKDGFCALGSTKPNIGYPITASVLPGLVKILQAFEHREIPPVAGFETANPGLDLNNGPFLIPQGVMPWKSEGPRRALLNGLSYSGAIVQLLLEEAPPTLASRGQGSGPYLFPLSAAEPEALARRVEELRRFLAEPDEELPELVDVAFTLAAGRSHLEHRLALGANSLEELSQELAALAEGEPRKRLGDSLREAAERFLGGESPEPPEVGRKIPLPTYPFGGERYWLESIHEAYAAPRAVPRVVFARRDGVFRALAGAGSPALLLKPGEVFRQLGPKIYQVRPAHCGDLETVLRTLGPDLHSAQFVHLWNHDATPVDFTRPGRLGRLASEVAGSLDTGRRTVEALLERLADLEPSFGGSILVVSHGEGAAAQPQNQLIEELAGRASDRLLELRFQTRVLPRREMDGAALARIVETALAGDGRRGESPAEPIPAVGIDEVAVQAGGLYVVAPGESALGLPRALAKRGAEVVVLVPEGSPSPSLEARFPVESVNLNQVDELAALLRRLESRFGEVRGLFITPEFLGLEEEATLSGLLLLDRWIGDRPLDVFALVGSFRAPGRHFIDLRRALGTAGYRFGETVRMSMPTGNRVIERPVSRLSEKVPRTKRNSMRKGTVIAGMVADLLHLERSAVDASARLDGTAVTSLVLTELSVLIQERFGVELTPARLYEQRTVAEVAELVADSLGAEEEEPVPSAPTPVEVTEPTPAPARSFDQEPIAIVGLAIRVPGARTPQDFWKLLRGGVDAIREFPAHRRTWQAGDEVKDPLWGGYLDSVETFDEAFFGISPLEARLMDPQQRLFLEAVWEAVESSGHCCSELAGSRTGVFAGVATADYGELLRRHGVPMQPHVPSGNFHSILANRVSFLLDLHGPSEPIDTACSSSLVAVLRAVDALRSGRCDLALAGGVNLILTPDLHAAFQQAGMLSPAGRCRTFSDRADGYVRGEGVGVVVLKPLAQAQRDGDPIRGLILGGAINHGGRARSLTAPNPRAQADLLVEAYRDAGIDPATVGHIEAHGTGTELGDPVEILGLLGAFERLHREWGRGAVEEAHCALGSVKSNIGHLEAAAGIAGLVKVLLAMEHRYLPRSLHCATLNPQIQLEGSPFTILQESRPWQPSEGTPLRAGVSSFGFGGVNAHVVLEEAPPVPAAGHESGAVLVPLSARDEQALGASAVALLRTVVRRCQLPQPGALAGGTRNSRNPSHPPPSPALTPLPLPAQTVCVPSSEHLAAEADNVVLGGVGGLADLAYTLQVGRDAHPQRLALVVESVDELARGLEAFGKGEAAGGLYSGSVGDFPGELLLGGEPGRAFLEAVYRLGDLDRLARLWVAGVEVDWELLHRGKARRRLVLPTYPFARNRHWLPGVPGALEEPAPTRRPAPRLPGLADGWLYVPEWRPATESHGGEADDWPGTAVLLAPSRADSMVETLEALLAPRPVVRVDLEEQRSVEDFEALLDSLGEIGSLFHLGGVMAPPLVGAEALERLEEEESLGLLSLWCLLAALRGREPVPSVTVITGGAESSSASRHPSAAALGGLVRVAAAETHGLRLRVLDVDRQSLGPALNASPEWGQAAVWRGGRRLVQRLVPLKLPRSNDLPWRQEGVYLLIGGAGTLGFDLSLELASRWRARLAWVGRGLLDGERQRRLAEVESRGGQVLYLRADVADPEAMAGAVAETLGHYGVIHGVVHTAFDFRRDALVTQDESVFHAALQAKCRGALALSAAVHELPLDFLLFFSSIQSLTADRGQAHYAAASNFLDAQVDVLAEQAPFPVRCIQWGYWGHGPAAGPEMREQLEMQGFRNIEPAVGLAACLEVPGLPVPRVVAVDGEVDALERLGAVDDVWMQFQPSMVAPALPGLLAGARRFFDEHGALSTLPGEVPGLATFCQRALRASLGDLGTPGLWVDRRELGEHLAVVPQQARLFDALLSLLEGGEPPTEGTWTELAPSLLDEKRRLAESSPAMAPRLDLLWTCLENLGPILRGQVAATEVVFPEGAHTLVEGFYRGNPVADAFNRMVATAVRSFVANCGEPVRLLELGAGTGSTSVAIFEALVEHGDAVHYTYTDLSPGFTHHGSKTFGGALPSMDFTVLDLERPLEEQGFAPGTYDLVLATNVVHATRDVRRSLARAKALLRRGGVLLLNEVTAVETILTLTFGTLEGWWRFDDAAERLPNSPLLDVAGWQRVLQAEGFVGVQALGRTVEEAGGWSQHLILAESDGLVRRESSLVVGEPSSVESVAESPSRPIEEVPQAVSGLQGTEDLEKRLEEHLAGLFGEALEIPAERVPRKEPFVDFGVDSILGVTVLKEINEAFGLSLRVHTIYDHSTVERLTAHLAAEHGAALEGALGAVTVVGETPAPIPQPVPESRSLPVRVETPEPPAGGEEIAIIGMSGRFPGARDVDEFWRNLADGVSSVGEIPAHRWPVESTYDPDPDRLDRTYCKWGGVLDDIDRFDARFFKLSNKEAELSDPQQRLFLEEAWRALEDAGYAGRPSLSCGVFAGGLAGDYRDLLKARGIREAQSLWGNDSALISGRISYFLNLEGPSLTLNAACSSSLVAIDLACQQLLAGRSELMLAGGVFLNTTPHFHTVASNAHMLSPRGVCSAFDQSADGFVPGEGVGVLVLKRLDQALRDGDSVHGVIKACLTNQDGATNGITAPSARSQAALEVAVYERAGLNPESIQMVEAHGTGTKLGDPIEVEALTKAFRRFTEAMGYCALGSVKTNIGHAALAAGVAGVIKILLSLKHGQIPPSCNFEQPNEHIDFDSSPFFVNTRLRPWPLAHGRRRAALSGFGMSGTNAHLVIEEAPVRERSAVTHREAWPILLSAKTASALARRVEDLRDFLEREDGVEIGDVAYTLAVRRPHLERRVAFVVSGREELLERLRAFRGVEDPVFVGGPERGETLLRSLVGRLGDRGRLEELVGWYVGAGEHALDLAWERLFRGETFWNVGLPTYPFEGERFWIPGGAQSEPEVRLRQTFPSGASAGGSRNSRNPSRPSPLPPPSRRAPSQLKQSAIRPRST